MKKKTFRIYDKTDGRMIYSSMPEEQGKREFYPIEFAIGFSHWKQEDLSEIMENVGLTDKSGKEIFEGDIVKSFDKIGEVCYHDLRATFIFHDAENYNERLCDKFPLEIIGNIFQNSELLPK